MEAAAPHAVDERWLHELSTGEGLRFVIHIQRVVARFLYRKCAPRSLPRGPFVLFLPPLSLFGALVLCIVLSACIQPAAAAP